MPTASAARYLSVLSVAWLASGCAPKLDVGSWNCASAPAKIPPDGGATTASSLPIEVPWSTGFEDGFCGYSHAGGFGYAKVEGSYEVVTSPVRTGRLAAAFTVNSAAASIDPMKPLSSEARCVREGILPKAAYYGAWFFIPAPVSNGGNWNLMHFQGAQTTEALQGIWDVSLENTSSGGLGVVMRDTTAPDDVPSMAPAEVTVGAWFHVQFFLQPRADNTGSVALYVNGQLVRQVMNIVTDVYSWAQWYVGNLANNLTPPESTIYVDDVTISDTL